MAEGKRVKYHNPNAEWKTTIFTKRRPTRSLLAGALDPSSNWHLDFDTATFDPRTLNPEHRTLNTEL
jgi:hypothetical protein